MGLIRSLAKRALESLVGKSPTGAAAAGSAAGSAGGSGSEYVPAPRSPSAASGSGRPPPPIIPSAGPGKPVPRASPNASPNAAPNASPSTALNTAPNAAAAAPAAPPAATPPTPAPKAPRPRHSVRPEDEAAAALLANLEAGAQEVKERMDAGEPVLLLDVREPFETAGGVIPGAVLVPLGQLPARWQELAGANEIVCYCAAGVRSVQAATLLREKGLFNATSLVGGISEWMQIGGKIVRPG